VTAQKLSSSLPRVSAMRVRVRDSVRMRYADCTHSLSLVQHGKNKASRLIKIVENLPDGSSVDSLDPVINRSKRHGEPYEYLLEQ
jgi:hypothetical protein